ncbi:MAG: alpha/beta hydrolase [Chitinophagaceae bacterium]
MENNQFIPFKNSTIFYRVCGEGKTVVLIHGFGEDGNIWNDIIKSLKNNFRVIVPDIPGSGRSTILKNENSETSIDDYAEAIINILKNESVSDCTVIGHSMGGYITLAIAEKYPETLHAFGLFHSTAFADNEERKQTRLKSTEFIKSHDAISFLTTSLPGLFADKFKQEHNDVIEKLIDASRSFSSETLIQYQKAMISRPDRTAVLQKTKLQVLFIIGEKDQVIPLQQSLAQCHFPSIASVHILPNAAHMGMLEESKLCTDIIISFLNNV